MKRKSLVQISIVTSAEAEDAVSELLQTQLDAATSSYTDAETGRVTVTSFVPALSQWPRARRELVAGLARIASFGIHIRPGRLTRKKLKPENWAESWKRHFKPIEIGSRLLVKPGWIKRNARPGQRVVVLDPGLSFGTGQHPTTAFCLRQLAGHRPADRNIPPPSFLDIGTGSGILAIAAAKLGFRPVDAFDFDPEAVRIAAANARRNRVQNRVRIWRADITALPLRSDKSYDVVCANLIAPLLIAERSRVVARLRPGGVLVLAGILKSEFAIIQRAYEETGLKLAASRAQKEWCSGAFQ